MKSTTQVEFMFTSSTDVMKGVTMGDEKGVTTVNTTDVSTWLTNVTDDDSLQDTAADITTGDIMKRIYIAIALVGLSGNAIVVITFGSFRNLRKKITNKYIINQSTIDFWASFMLLLGFTTVEDNKIEFTGFRADALCKLWYTKLFLWSLLVSSTWNLVILTIERYTEVVHPIWHKTHFSVRWCHITLAIPWAVGIGWNVGYMLPTSKVVDGSCGLYAYWPSATFRKVFGCIIVLIQFLIPLFTLIFCYGKIALVLTKRIKVEPKDVQKTDAERLKDEKWHKARRNTIKTLAIVSLCFVVCWSCNQIYYLMFNLGYPEDWSSNFYHFTVFMVFLNSCINPFIYALKYQEFQNGFRKRFCACLRKTGVEGDFTSTTGTTGGTAQSTVK